MSHFDAQHIERLVDDLVAMGLAYDTDFYVTGINRGGPGLLSSEFYALTWDRDEDRFRVWYRDMGVKTVLLTTPDFAQARARLQHEAIVLAGGRGRGPRARPDVHPETPINEVLGRIVDGERPSSAIVHGSTVNEASTVRFRGERLRAPDGRIVVPAGRHRPDENGPSPTEVAALVADILRKHIDPFVGDTHDLVPLPVDVDPRGVPLCIRLDVPLDLVWLRRSAVLPDDISFPDVEPFGPSVLTGVYVISGADGNDRPWREAGWREGQPYDGPVPPPRRSRWRRHRS